MVGNERSEDSHKKKKEDNDPGDEEGFSFFDLLEEEGRGCWVHGFWGFNRRIFEGLI